MTRHRGIRRERRISRDARICARRGARDSRARHRRNAVAWRRIRDDAAAGRGHLGDGAYVGRTPAFVDLLSAGKHTIVVTRTGWEAQSATIQVSIGQVVQVSLVLPHTSGTANTSHDFGELVVRGSPAGAAVYVDGKKLGVIPLNATKIAAGYHIVSVVGKPDERSTRDVNVYPDTTTTISITAGEPGGPTGDILEPVSSIYRPRTSRRAAARSRSSIAAPNCSARSARARTRLTAKKVCCRSRPRCSRASCICRSRSWNTLAENRNRARREPIE